MTSRGIRISVCTMAISLAASHRDSFADDFLALAVACRDVDVRNVKALIIGPHETPYEFGFFEVGSTKYKASGI